MSVPSVASAGVREAGRDDIERRRVDEHRPDRVTVGQAVARMFGAEIANADPETPAEPFVYRPNRAERRARAKQARRGRR